MAAFRNTFSSWFTRAAGIVLLLVLFFSLFGGALVPYDPLLQDTDNTFAQVGATGHPLGTDYLGRDTLSRLMDGAGPSVLSALAMVVVGLLLGALPGVLSAFVGRLAEFAMVRISDAFLTLPPIVFAIAVIGMFTNGELAAIVAIGILLAPRFYRIARAEALVFSHAHYVEAATLLGASRWTVVRRHVLRKVVPTLAVATANATGLAVLTAASLGFLGLGVTAPNPTWGGMLASDVQYLSEDRIGPIWPGLCIALTVWALNVLADGLREGLKARSAVPEGTARRV